MAHLGRAQGAGMLCWLISACAAQPGATQALLREVPVVAGRPMVSGTVVHAPVEVLAPALQPIALAQAARGGFGVLRTSLSPQRAAESLAGLSANAALVVDLDHRQVLLDRNGSAVLPIASITKLMTALVVLRSGQPLEEVLTVTQDDVDTLRRSRSRLPLGSRLTRRALLELALMASENRAAHALARAHPGGALAMVTAMNSMASRLQMRQTHFADPAGLSSENQSTALDLVKLVREAYRQPLLRSWTVNGSAEVVLGARTVGFRNTNPLVAEPQWQIGLQKTGYIVEAGRCLVMQTELAGRNLVLVLLDAAGGHSRFTDAERIRRWLEADRESAGESLPAPVLQAVRQPA